MAVSTIGVADADTPDKYLHTHQRTISATAREDQYVQQGESAYPTYSAVTADRSVATTADHVMQIMGDGTNYSRIKRVSLYGAVATTATNLRLEVWRLSTAGTSGTTITPRPYDTADTYGGGAAYLPSSKGTEGVLLLTMRVYMPAAAGQVQPPVIWEELPGMKPIIFGPATSNGIAFKVGGGVTGGTVDLNVEFITTSYL
jgi:hypothetical protein